MQNIPKRYADVKYEDVRQDIKASFESMKDTRRGIYIHGEVGTGKTHIMYALLKETEIKHKVVTLAKNTVELLRSIQSDFSRPWDQKMKEEDHVRDFKGLLFLDDVGVEKSTEWTLETFYLILNARYNDVLPTIFTSNLSPANLSEKWGDRIASRIIGSCDVFRLEGEDRRLINN